MSPPESLQAIAGPTPVSERMQGIDILRGLALFGILASNMRAFNSPLGAYFNHSVMWQSAIDRLTQAIIDVFISQKFITLFSFLFGLGFAIMLERMETRGLDARTLYHRRLRVLLAFGLVHILFFWYGDILTPYALMGFVLLAFRKSSNRKVLGWAIGLYLWPFTISALMTGVAGLGFSAAPPDFTSPAQLAASIRIYSTGTFAEILRHRMTENVFMAFGMLFFYPRFLGMFLFGLLAWRKGIFQNLPEHLDLLRRGRNWGFGLGLPLNVAAVVVMEAFHPNPLDNTPLTLLVNLLQTLGVPCLSIAYAATVLLLTQSDVWRARLRPFGAVGRSALSNYLTQTLLCTAIFYSWGLGLYGTVAPLPGLVLTILIYAVQVVWSHWWMRRFLFGPFEWVWRSLTYGHPQKWMA